MSLPAPIFKPYSNVAKQMPAAFPWDSSYVPITATLTNISQGRYYGSDGYTAEQRYNQSGSTALTAPANTYYVNSLTGSNSNNGLSAGAALRSIWKATELANATGLPAKVIVAATGDIRGYERQHGFCNTAAVTSPTVDIAYLASGNAPVIVGSWDNPATAGYTWAQVSTSNCYSTSRSNVNRVVDLKQRDKYGKHKELKYVTTAALCQAIPGSWALVSGVCYVNREDGLIPDTGTGTAPNTRLYLKAPNVDFSVNVNIFFGGLTSADSFRMEGGNGWRIRPTTQLASKKSVIFSNCVSWFSGGVSDTLDSRGFSNDGWYGLTACYNTCVNGCVSDAYNFHNGIVITANGSTFNGYLNAGVLTVTSVTSGTIKLGSDITGTSILAGTKIISAGTGNGGVGTYITNNTQTLGSSGSPVAITATIGATDMQALTVNCEAYDCGAGGFGTVSNNFLTGHEVNIKIVDIAGYSLDSRGGAVRSIEYAKIWCVGTFIENDLGDYMNGGTVAASAFNTKDFAKYWLDTVTAKMPAGTFAINTETSTSAVYIRNMNRTSGLIGGVGTINSY